MVTVEVEIVVCMHVDTHPRTQPLQWLLFADLLLAIKGHVLVSRDTSRDNVCGATRILARTKAPSMSSPSQPGSTVSVHELVHAQKQPVAGGDRPSTSERSRC